MSDDELRALRDRLASLGMTPIVSSGLTMGPFESALRSARVLDAKVIRHGLTNVLCGDRHALGDKWRELVAHVRAELADRGPRAADEGRVLAIENHQDFGSDELARILRSDPWQLASASTPATPFRSPRRRSISSRRVAPHVRHVHLKDYRVQFTDEGYRLVRCAIGDGAVPMAAMLDILAGQRPEADRGARAWSARSPARAAVCDPNGGAATRRSRRRRSRPASPPRGVNRLPDDADYRTPWERGDDAAIVGLRT